MEIFVLFAQRKEHYEGEYAPECLAVMSEWDMEENPAYMTDEKSKADATGEFERTETISLSVSDADVMSRLRPGTKPIPARVT